MKIRICTAVLLLVTLLATRLLDVHFHLPPQSSSETAHVVALAFIQVHQHDGEADHGHIASHLYEGEMDEDEGAGLLSKASFTALIFVPLLLALLVLAWRIAASLPLPQRHTDPPRPRRWARKAPPSQAPPIQA